MSDSTITVRKRRRFSKEDQIRWVEQYLQSGLSQRDFALKHNLGFSSVQRWVARHATPSPACNAVMKPVFTELKLPAMGPSARWAAELARPDGTVLRLAHDAPQSLIWQVARLCCP